jgi:hypothetical protein
VPITVCFSLGAWGKLYSYYSYVGRKASRSSSDASTARQTKREETRKSIAEDDPYDVDQRRAIDRKVGDGSTA